MRALAITALVACGGAPIREVSVTRTELMARGVVAATEQSDVLYVFERDRATIARAGTAVATVRPPAGEWTSATTLAAFDGDGTWVVARASTGALWRITASGELEPIHDRIGVGSVTAIGAAAATVALAIADGVAVLRDPAHVARFATPRADELAVGRDRIALRRGDEIEVWDFGASKRVTYEVPRATQIAFVDAAHAPRLVVATDEQLYVERDGKLAPVATPGRLGSIAVAGTRIWLRSDSLYALDDGVLSRVAAAPAGHLFGLADGDVVISSRDHAVRLSLTPAADPSWDTTVRPIFQRVCARCHLPGGEADVDLSTLHAWQAERAELVDRVVETRTMPPAGVELSEKDRAALAAWLRRR